MVFWMYELRITRYEVRDVRGAIDGWRWTAEEFSSFVHRPSYIVPRLPFIQDIEYPGIFYD